MMLPLNGALCGSVNTFSEFITLREVVNRGRGGRHQVAVGVRARRRVQDFNPLKLVTKNFCFVQPGAPCVVTSSKFS